MAFLTKRGMVQEDVCGVNFSENTSPLARNSTGLLSGRSRRYIIWVQFFFKIKTQGDIQVAYGEGGLADASFVFLTQFDILCY